MWDCLHLGGSRLSFCTYLQCQLLLYVICGISGWSNGASKFFFRVGTAILFLSQPILLNHDLEGMMTYLNTIPDATLLQPDILIPCALNIKVTNRMLQELEAEVMKHP
mmetsp:Transcript_11355/g.20053  ORF Transcript_11355/g.20053 Transcript_11355/m.20053 type:complete len:108 (+) Transcript_11355:557-880(+)